MMKSFIKDLESIHLKNKYTYKYIPEAIWRIDEGGFDEDLNLFLFSLQKP